VIEILVYIVVTIIAAIYTLAIVLFPRNELNKRGKVLLIGLLLYWILIFPRILHG